MLIREAESGYSAPCAEIYEPYVTDSVASFELVAPSAGDMAARIRASYCWLIAEAEEAPVGYAYAASHHERAAYRWAADVAIHIDAAHRRSGVGRALYGELFDRLRAMGLWTLCAGITQPNAASNGLHAAMGFRRVGTYRRIGWKAGAWHDVQWWQLDLRPGDPGPPEEPVGSAA
jgi:L-amino acid N-acyltransferase YncA